MGTRMHTGLYAVSGTEPEKLRAADPVPEAAGP